MPSAVQAFLAIASLLIVAFGQPAWSSLLSAASAAIGYALFWRFLLCFPKSRTRFWLGTLWFTAVQLVQLSWFLSHPYWYILTVYLLFSLIVGLQFGLLCYLLDSARLRRLSHLLFLAAAWTLLEWSRLFFMGGYTWNPAGLALAANLYSMQTASLAGVFGLTFWVMLTNLFALRASLFPSVRTALIWGIAAVAPYLFGAGQIALLDQKEEKASTFTAVLVQPSFPVEEAMDIGGVEEWVAFVEDEWRQILTITAPHLNKPADIVVLPEFVVPFGTYTMMYSYDRVKALFDEVYGEAAKLPPLALPYAKYWEGKWYVNNAFWAQGIAESFQSGVIAGMEDVDVYESGEREYWSAGLLFRPGHGPTLSDERYAKRVLVPLGEYIPFEFCRSLAASYGVCGSFTPGKGPKVWDCNGCGVGVSICYEETFGDLMRENKQMGAELLVNLTSDAWYPNSKLTQQHLDHARLRTVENGFPLLRSCNTGITCAFDSFGREIAILGKGESNFESLSDALYVEVPLHTYTTLYSKLGDSLIAGLSLLIVLASLRRLN